MYREPTEPDAFSPVPRRSCPQRLRHRRTGTGLRRFSRVWRATDRKARTVTDPFRMSGFGIGSNPFWADPMATRAVESFVANDEILLMKTP